MYKFSSFVSMLCLCALERERIWKSRDNFRESFPYIYHVGPRDQSSVTGHAASAVPSGPSRQPWILALKSFQKETVSTFNLRRVQC